MFKYSLYACIIGFILDLIVGDPYFLYHPVRLIGKLIEIFERILRKIFTNKPSSLKVAGFILVLIVCFITTGTAFIINIIAYKLNIFLGIGTESIICYFMFAAKSLKTESMKVYKRLETNDIEGARKAVSMIVGRDTKNLDKQGIIKASVETVAENLSDGVIAPLIYILLGGSVFGVFYKTINTMDSMIGYKNDEYIYFGRYAAKLDDAANFIPSRLSALMMILASVILKKDYKNAIRVFKRDRFKHSSPNSAQTESVCAGALRIQLAGSAYYFGKLYKKPFIGDSIECIKAINIVDANRLMYVSAILTMLIFGGLKLIIILIGGDIL